MTIQYGSGTPLVDRSAIPLEHEMRWYANGETAPDLPGDYALCAKDAAEGNERAIRYLTKFTELQLKGE